MEIKTILAEAVVNCMIHGYQGREEGQVRVSVSYDETHRVTIEVKDSGVGIEDITLARRHAYTTRADLERSGMGDDTMESLGRICRSVFILAKAQPSGLSSSSNFMNDQQEFSTFCIRPSRATNRPGNSVCCATSDWSGRSSTASRRILRLRTCFKSDAWA